MAMEVNEKSISGPLFSGREFYTRKPGPKIFSCTRSTSYPPSFPPYSSLSPPTLTPPLTPALLLFYFSRISAALQPASTLDPTGFGARFVVINVDRDLYFSPISGLLQSCISSTLALPPQCFSSLLALFQLYLGLPQLSLRPDASVLKLPSAILQHYVLQSYFSPSSTLFRI